IPCLAMLIQHGAVWIVAHFRGADFMDDLAASRNTPLAVGARFVGDNAARRLDDVLERLLHVLGLQDLVLAPLEVKTQHGNAPLIDGVGIDLTIAVFVRDHFAASGETDVSAINFAKILLQLGAISAAEYALRTRQDAGARLIAAAAELNVIATREWHFAGFLLLIIPPGHVHMHTADAVLVLRGKVLKDREESAHRRADRVHDVASDETRRVRQAVGKLAALRIKHDAGGLTATRRQDDDFAVNRNIVTSLFIDVRNTTGESVVADNDLANHRAGAHFEIAGLHRREDVHAGGVEVGVDAAGPSALRAIVTSGAAV